MQTNVRIRDIKGLTPAVDPTQSQEAFVLNGRNYAFDSLGPASMFGDKLLLPQPLGAPQHTQGVRLKLRGGDRSFTFTSDGILEWDEAAGGWKVIYVTPSLRNAPHRWTWAYLNGYVYFCHPRTGILVYNLDTNRCYPHRGPGVPEEALAILVNNGFLCVLNPERFSWSQPSNGLDFTPTLGGAGFQILSARVSGYPVMLTSYTNGCLIWTTGGVMRSEFTGDSEVYRHRALQTEYRPINSFCTCRIDDDTVVILDERGLFQSKGEAPQPFTPLFNEFIGPYIQRNMLAVGDNVRIEWDELRRFMYVSISLSYAEPIYEDAFVLYPNLDKWGSFNEKHYGILPVKIHNSDRAGDYFGFVDQHGAVRYWDLTGSREVIPGPTTLNRRSQNLGYPVIQKPAHANSDDGGWILSSSARVDVAPAAKIPTRAGYYVNDSTAIAPADLTGLDSVVQIGFMRVQGDESADQLSEIINVMVRNLLPTGDPNRENLDYALVPAGVSDEDYNNAIGSDDYGTNSLNYMNHGLTVTGTVDAVTTFDSTDPTLTNYFRGGRYYSCSVTGLWHLIELRAVALGEMFHPTTIELTAVDAGRLT